MGKTCTITPVKNGPYLLRGLTRIDTAAGPVEGNDPVALCRCGQSAAKPFCDGSHGRVGFKSDKADGRTPGRLDSYPGEQITIHDNRSICAHAGRCTDGLPGVWRMGKEPWIDPDAASVADIVRVIKSCPSGALSYTTPEGGEPAGVEHPAGVEPPAVFVAPKGPYVVSGEVELADGGFEEGANRQRYTLCRCGASSNKPFCDGTHWNVEFDT